MTDEVWDYVGRCVSCILKAAVMLTLSIMIIDVLLIACSIQAEKMAKKADAWKEYKEAAMVDMMLQTLPKAKGQFSI